MVQVHARRLRRFAAVGLALMVAAGCSGDDPTPNQPDPGPEDCPENSWPTCTAPAEDRPFGTSRDDFSYEVRGTDQFHDEVTLRQFRGATTVLIFSATWCSPCQAEAAVFDEYRSAISEGAEGPVWVIEILTDAQSEPRQVDWAEAFGIDMPVLGGIEAARSADRMLVSSYPTKFVLDHEHRVLDWIVGTGQVARINALVLEAEARRLAETTH